MIDIKCSEVTDSVITVPGSKSFSHRILIASALSDGVCEIDNLLFSEDTTLTMNMLSQLGIRIEENGGRVVVHGGGGQLNLGDNRIYLGNSGTSMRLLSGLAAMGSGRVVLEGTPRMHERPIQDLLGAINGIGGDVRSLGGNGNPPVEVLGRELSGGEVTLDLSLSSQFLSSILLVAPYTKDGVTVNIPMDPVSKPYIDLTVGIMEKMGVAVERDGYRRFRVEGGQVYRSGSYVVDPDCSQASYFWGAAAVTGRTVKVRNVTRDVNQGDVGFAEVLGKMGCRVAHEPDGISVTGGKLKGVKVDMSGMPDVVPTLAVVASFAEGVTEVTNVAHLKEKECDRLGSVALELRKMGVDAVATDSGLKITGGNPSASVVETYDDHRMAMSFAIAGLRVPGVQITDEMCVRKSFPNYWEVFEELYK